MDEKLALVYRYFQLLESFSADATEFASIFHRNESIYLYDHRIP